MTPTLLAVPNVSEGRDRSAIDAIASAFDARPLDVHSDPDHNRSVFTLRGAPGELARSVLHGAEEAIRLIDINQHLGAHPCVGVLDVAPIVYLKDGDRGAACAEALVLADMLGHELNVPVYLYGELAGGRTRAELRRGGPAALSERDPDFGPRQLHPTAGATLVAARPPLIAFNLDLKAPASDADAKRIAAEIREGGTRGLHAVRAIGIWLEERQVAQVSTNVEDYRRTSLADVVAAVGLERVARTELVGLAPKDAFDGFPEDVEVMNLRLI